MMRCQRSVSGVFERRSVLRIGCLTALLLACLVAPAVACLPETYQRLNRHCIQEGRVKQLLNVVFGELARPRQIAVVAGVSSYLELSIKLQLPPVDHDIEMLIDVLIKELHFDEVIVLKNEDFNGKNLDFIFQNYLPHELRRNPKSRVIFAFSGHGADFDNSGFLFLPNTKTIDPRDYLDLTDAINLATLKVTMAPTIRNAQHFLALINACNGGYFLDVGVRFGKSSLEEKGAHGITAGGAKDAVHAYENVGTGKGSVFFEMIVAALSGREVTVGGRKFTEPSKDDGILTTTELAGFLSATIGIIENYKLSPRMGSLTGMSPGKQGEFFFVTDYERAKTTLRREFPKRAARVFGDGSASGRESGLYARRSLPKGAMLSAEMFVAVEAARSQELSEVNTPTSFSKHVEGSCLDLPLKQGERLTWNHLSIDCK